MANKSTSLQDTYLNSLRKEKVTVAIYLINGIKLSGLVSSFDQYAVVLRDSNNKVSQLIYKHAISTIVPSREFSLSPSMLDESGE